MPIQKSTRPKTSFLTWGLSKFMALTGADSQDAVGDPDLATSAARFAALTEWVGEAEFAHLELAFSLADLGLVGEAAAFTRAALVADRESPRPLPLYTIAYFAHQLGNEDESRRLLTQAAATEADYVFPSRPEMIAVLRHAISENPDDARANAYLGNLYAGLGRLDEAGQAWRRAVELDGARSVAARNLGLLAWKRDADLSAAASWHRAAMTARPDDQTLHRDLARILIEQGDSGAAITVLEILSADEFRRPDVVVLLADTYADVGRLDDAIALLEATTFNNREGVRDTWSLTRLHFLGASRRLPSHGLESVSNFDGGPGRCPWDGEPFAVMSCDRLVGRVFG